MRSINVAGLLIALLASSFVPAGQAADADRAAEMAARDQTAELYSRLQVYYHGLALLIMSCWG